MLNYSYWFAGDTDTDWDSDTDGAGLAIENQSHKLQSSSFDVSDLFRDDLNSYLSLMIAHSSPDH